MQNQQEARAALLAKVENALANGKVEMPFPEIADAESDAVFVSASSSDLSAIFKEAFIALGGNFLYCANQSDMVQKLMQLVAEKKWQSVHCVEEKLLLNLKELPFVQTGTDYSKLETAITTCEYLVARTGSMMLSSSGESGRALSVYTPIHICVAYTSQLVWNIGDATQKMQEKYGANLPSTFNIATGPSRTADIEKTLVVGVHGPKEVYLLLIDDTTHAT